MPQETYGPDGQLRSEPLPSPSPGFVPNSKIGIGIPGLGAQSPAQDKPPSPIPGEGPAAYAKRLKEWRAAQRAKQKKVGGLDPATLQGVVMQQLAGSMGMDGSLQDAVNGGGMFQRPDDNLNQAIASLVPLIGQG